MRTAEAVAIGLASLVVFSNAKAGEPSGETSMEILKITQHPPTKLSSMRQQNTSSISVSGTGVVAAFYGYDGAPRFFRTSTDGGLTWGPETPSPPEMGGGQCTVPLADGGALRPAGRATPIEGESGWFEATVIRFNDDFSEHVVEQTRIYMPGAITKRVERRSYVWYWPNLHAMTTLECGDLMAVMYGLFEGDAVGTDHGSRVIAVRSGDQGRTWLYHGTISNQHEDPNPELPGMFAGFTESSIALLPDGRLLCMMRSQGSHLPSEYRPFYVAWSADEGKTWTKPTPTRPHLMNIQPSVFVLDNGVVASVFGRPGVHAAFSTDYGRKWANRISLSHLPVNLITGQVDGRKVGPNRLAVIGGVDDGTWIYPITVERVNVSSSRSALVGRVLDTEGNPVAGAKVESSLNRYVAHDWKIVPAPEGLPGFYHEPHLDQKMMPDTPQLSYRSIQANSGYPVIESDGQGHFRFDAIAFGETILTVEADGFAPQHRHINHGPDAPPVEFKLDSGRAVRGRVQDQDGLPVAGACVVLGLWHCHTETDGRFSWSVSDPVPAEVAVKVHKRYSGRYAMLDMTLPLSKIENQPLVLKTVQESSAAGK
jgi:hypothetical protein